MRRSIIVAAFVVLAGFLISGSATFAGKDKAPAEKAAAKEVTLKGSMVCAKCALKEAPKCQSVLKVTEDGKEVKYYLAEGAAAKEAHGKVCGGSANATVKGTVSEDKGKKILAASEVKYD